MELKGVPIALVGLSAGQAGIIKRKLEKLGASVVVVPQPRKAKRNAGPFEIVVWAPAELTASKARGSARIVTLAWAEAACRAANGGGPVPSIDDYAFGEGAAAADVPLPLPPRTVRLGDAEVWGVGFGLLPLFVGYDGCYEPSEDPAGVLAAVLGHPTLAETPVLLDGADACTSPSLCHYCAPGLCHAAV